MKFINTTLILIICVLLTGCDVEQKEDYSQLYENFPQKFTLNLEIEGTASDTLEVGLSSAPNIRISRDQTYQNTFVDSDGNVLLEILIDRPSTGFLYIKDETFAMSVIPNETSSIKYNVASKEINFLDEGDDSFTINKYYQRKKELLGYVDYRAPFNKKLNNVLDFKSIIRFVDSLTMIELNFFQKQSKIGRLPTWFIDYEKAQINYQNLSIKTELPMINEVFGFIKAKPSNNYFSFLDTIRINDESAILSSNYFSFLKNTFIKDLPLDSFNSHSGFTRLQIIHSHRLKYSKDKLTKNVKDIFHREMFSQILRYYSDSSQIDSLAKEYGVKNYTALNQLVGTVKTTKSGVKKVSNGAELPELLFVNEIDSLISIKELSTSLTYINIWATWCGPCIKNFPTLNNTIDSLSRNEIQFINICLSSKKDHWLTLINKHDLKGINLFAEGNWNERIKDAFGLTGFPHYAIIKDNLLIENNTDKTPFVNKKLLELSQQ